MNSPPPTPFAWLERVTAAVLLAVLLALGWVVCVAYQPGWLRLAPLEVEVAVILLVLVAALLLVSVVALLHTRP
jgi:hypothetical protein